MVPHISRRDSPGIYLSNIIIVIIISYLKALIFLKLFVIDRDT